MKGVLLLLMLCAPLFWSPPTVAQPAENLADSKIAAPPPAEDLRLLLELLGRPDIQAWLKAQAEHAPVSAQNPALSSGSPHLQEIVAGTLDAARSSLHELAGAAPTLTGELNKAKLALMNETMERGPAAVLLPLFFFVGLGFGLEWLFWLVTASFRRRTIATSLDTVEERLRAAGRRVLYGLGLLLSFAGGSVGAFLLFDWPPLLQQTVLSYLLVFLVIRLTLVAGRFMLAPGAERFRLMPVATVCARFWFVWATVLVGWFAFGHFTYQLLPGLGVAHEAAYLLALGFGLILLCLALFALWRCPTFDGAERVGDRHRVGTVLVSLYLIATWLVAFSGKDAAFYIGVVLLVVPIAISCVRLSVRHVLRPVGAELAEAPVLPSLAGAAVEHGLRALLLIGGAYLIASLLGVDLGRMTTGDTMTTRLLRGAINAFIIILLADFAWHVASAWIDRRLVETVGEGPSRGEEAKRHARLRTLLPILRNVLFVVLFVMAALMALSGLGVEIGPLIAGAGVVGIAVGFGAQALVKDVISGMFFLFDDAFRTGEYIESGSIKGTVESFSLRSMKIRHHRGALHTVPFGSLDKITNYSRDWAIDKITISVTYDTDLDAVKKIIKEVGKQLAADEELAPNIMETLKMQGVEQFGDFAVQIRTKIMTKPGEQAVIRRRAYALIKKAFDANGIKFAFPTVTVAGGDVGTAVAQKGLELVKPPPTPGQTDSAA